MLEDAPIILCYEDFLRYEYRKAIEEAFADFFRITIENGKEFEKLGDAVADVILSDFIQILCDENINTLLDEDV